ncbi:glycosyltransferase family 4 protein [Thioalkalicoccus limnaeus]|uniref:Glycosyltransferase family 4 protein n=1 Tax=Thioalkalicoccus limnaeus TaxID=120681 RepID=A0ABV4BJU0_9GAMM
MWKTLDRYSRSYALRVAHAGFADATWHALRRLLDRALRRPPPVPDAPEPESELDAGPTRESAPVAAEDSPAPADQCDILASYRMVSAGSVDPAPGPLVPRSMNWIVPAFSLGSGGHLNIFRMIAMLESRGYPCRIFLPEQAQLTDAAHARELINTHFVPLAAEVGIGLDAMPCCEFVVATGWDTAYWAKAFTGARHRLYFVQDFEPYFYSRSSEYALAEHTYRMGFVGLTAGGWLAEKLRTRYGMTTHAFGFSFDKDRYRPQPRLPGPRRVFFYARHVTPRRGFDLGLLALERVHRRCPDVEFVLAGWDCSAFAIPFPYRDMGVAPLDELPGLYAQCDVALVLSLTNLSLLPLEVMACGCPVVSNRGPNVEWLLRDGENASLADPTPDALAAAVIAVLEDADLRARLIEGGLGFAAATDWEVEGQRVAERLQSIAATPDALDD